jgi:hypothetical protein
MAEVCAPGSRRAVSRSRRQLADPAPLGSCTILVFLALAYHCHYEPTLGTSYILGPTRRVSYLSKMEKMHISRGR